MQVKGEYVECLKFILDQKEFIDADLIWDLHREAKKIDRKDTLMIERASLEFWANDLALHGVGDIQTAEQIDKLLMVKGAK